MQGGLNKLTPTRTPQITVKNQNFFDFLKVSNELGKVSKFFYFQTPFSWKITPIQVNPITLKGTPCHFHFILDMVFALNLRMKRGIGLNLLHHTTIQNRFRPTVVAHCGRVKF